MAPAKSATNRKQAYGKKYAKKDMSKINIAYLLPIIAAVAVVPLIVLLKIYSPGGQMKEFWPGGDTLADFFSYYKFIVLMLAAVAGILMLLINKMNNNTPLRRTYVYLPAGIYALFVLLSTVFAQYKQIATSGFVDRLEGVYALLAYLVLLFVTINLIQTDRHIKYVIAALLISSAIIGLIGMFQYLGLDFFKSDFGKSLIAPGIPKANRGSINFTFGNSVAYSTLYNPDYVGSYVALLIPVCVGLFLFVKKIALKIGIALLACVLLVALIGSQSMAGFIGLAVGVLLLVLFFRKAIIRHIKPAGIVVISLAVLLVGFNYISGGSISRHISTLLNNSAGQSSANPYIDDIIADGQKLQIITDTQTITMGLNKGAVAFYGKDGKNLGVNQNQNTITFPDKAYSYFKFQFLAQNRIDCYVGSKEFIVDLQDTGIKLEGWQGKPIDITHPEKINIGRRETALSARAYIWSRSVPLLTRTILVGHGPDTFAAYFPQADMVGKLNAYNKTGMFVDKAHNLYLQIALNTGVLSLLAFLALIVMYAVSSFKLYFNKNAAEYKDYIGIALFCAICSYCVTGLANDSVISVAPVFWVLLGLGIACNMMVKGKTPIVGVHKK